jgi:hypothetical protein
MSVRIGLSGLRRPLRCAPQVAALGAVLLTAAACTLPAASDAPNSVTIQTGEARSGGGNGAGSEIARKHCSAWGKTPVRSGETAQSGSEDLRYACR